MANGLASENVFKALVTLISLCFVVQVALVCYHQQTVYLSPLDLKKATKPSQNGRAISRDAKEIEIDIPVPELEMPPHFLPLLKPLPAVVTIEDTGDLLTGTLDGSRPTITGIAIVLQRFLLALHKSNEELGQKPNVNNEMVVPAYINLVEEHLLLLEAQYRGRSIFPIREDDSIFISAAAFRDYLFGETLKDAFRHAKNPDKIFIGAVVQNCFGISYTCRTGVEVVGKGPNGRDRTKISDAPPDKNGVEEFCTDLEFKKYCDAGQIRALYVNETEAVGPAVARHFASKLWGGETYFIQVDAHLQFVQDWDEAYIAEIKATKSYPKSILSAYPPNFGVGNLGEESVGTRLCTCTFSTSDVEHDIIRINNGHRYNGHEKAPTQIAFMAAGFFMTRAEFLIDVPFDPFLPWCFMGEEIALSMRAWTAGWNMYAPRRNLIAHQYRPGRMGLPKFWESVGRTFKHPGPGFSNSMQDITLKRVKYMVGYPEITAKSLRDEGHDYILKDIAHYGMGKVRERKDYIELARIDFNAKTCRNLKWCNMGEME